MTGWLVNDHLTTIPGVATFWHHLLGSIPGLVDKTTGSYWDLADTVEREAKCNPPDYIIRNAAFFRSLDVEVPVISVVQDIIGLGYPEMLRHWVLESCYASRLVVFNTEYTRAAYPELANAPYRIIPIGTDDELFRWHFPHAGIPDNAVLWVGSGNPIKGFNLARRLAAESARPWVFVMKDEIEVPEAFKVFSRISQQELASLAATCAVGVCTSVQETQHLAGIEMGMCGLPLVATDVGVYYRRHADAWGMVSNGDWHDEIELVSRLDRKSAATYWRMGAFDLPSCMAAWQDAVRSLEAEHVVR